VALCDVSVLVTETHVTRFSLFRSLLTTIYPSVLCVIAFAFILHPNLPRVSSPAPHYWGRLHRRI